MVDLSEQPATPPEDHGGDARIGLEIAGILLAVAGWGFAVIGNLLVHAVAPSAGYVIWNWIRIYPGLGTYAWATLGFGLVTGAIGVSLFVIGRHMPRGRFVLPGYPY